MDGQRGVRNELQGSGEGLSDQALHRERGPELTQLQRLPLPTSSPASHRPTLPMRGMSMTNLGWSDSLSSLVVSFTTCAGSSGWARVVGQGQRLAQQGCFKPVTRQLQHPSLAVPACRNTAAVITYASHTAAGQLCMQTANAASIPAHLQRLLLLHCLAVGDEVPARGRRQACGLLMDLGHIVYLRGDSLTGVCACANVGLVEAVRCTGCPTAPVCLCENPATAPLQERMRSNPQQQAAQQPLDAPTFLAIPRISSSAAAAAARTGASVYVGSRQL